MLPTSSSAGGSLARAARGVCSTVRAASRLLLCVGFIGCSPAEGGTDPGTGSGGNVMDSFCGADQTQSVEAGEGVGSAFSAFEKGDLLPLEFASQAGLEAPVSLRLFGFALGEITSIELELEVDSAPIGVSTTSASSVRCEEENGRVDTALPIDVGGHPTVSSVAQLKDTEGVLRIDLLSGKKIVLSTSLEVVLDP